MEGLEHGEEGANGAPCTCAGVKGSPASGRQTPRSDASGAGDSSVPWHAAS